MTSMTKEDELAYIAYKKIVREMRKMIFKVERETEGMRKRGTTLPVNDVCEMERAMYELRGHAYQVTDWIEELLDEEDS